MGLPRKLAGAALAAGAAAIALPRLLTRRPTEQPVPAAAYYQQAEIYRLRGEFAEAEESYRRASGQGREPLPGLVLLWLAQGRTEAAAAAITRALGTTADRLPRTKLLSACVEIMIASGDRGLQSCPGTKDGLLGFLS